MILAFFCLGITNHDEYSLVRDLPEAEREKTLTLKRDKSIAKDQKKMDVMKRKLHTDDECKLSHFVLDFVQTLENVRTELATTDELKCIIYIREVMCVAHFVSPLHVNLLSICIFSSGKQFKGLRKYQYDYSQ